MLVREHISENFREKSDPIRDMQIGANPTDIFHHFVKDYTDEFGLKSKISYCGEVYDVIKETVIDINFRYETQNHPINKIIASESGTYGLLFVTTDESARQIFEKDDATWGFFYEMKGTRKKLKSIQFNDVIKELLGFREIDKKNLDNAIKKYETYISEVKKMIEILNES